LRDSLPIDVLLPALSFLVVAQSSSEVPEGLMNNPVFPVDICPCPVLSDIVPHFCFRLLVIF